LSIRISSALAQRLGDRARGRADAQRNLQGTDGTHADSEPGGHISDIIREAITHYLDGCDREFQEPKPAAKATATKRDRTSARSA
jgi:hypothetical protein